MTREALAALLATLAALALGRAVRLHALRPAAAGLVVLAGADIARIWTFERLPRLDVILSFAWPVVAGVLVLGWWGLAWLGWALLLARWGAALAPWWSWALQGPRVVLGAAVTVVALRRASQRPGSAGHRQDHAPDAGAMRRLRTDRDPSRWGALGGPPPEREAPGGGSTWSPSELVGLLLVAGQVAAIVAGLWADWSQVRILTALIYGGIGMVVWGARE